MENSYNLMNIKNNLSMFYYSKTRSKLIRKFGSIRGLRNASEIEVVAAIGPVKAKLALSYIQMIQS